MEQRGIQKLAMKLFGPFHVIARVGKEAYKLALPDGSIVHDIFHVSLLRKFYDTLHIASHIPLWVQGQSTDIVLQTLDILDRKIVKRQNKPCVQFLVQWKGLYASEATWIDEAQFESKFSDCALP